MKVPARWWVRMRMLGVLAGGAALIAGCGSSGGQTVGSPAVAGARGTVQVLYAGSLVNMMEHDLGPKFGSATGFQYRGIGAGSTELANQIKGRVHAADVFISASPAVNSSLEGTANGSWVSWYARFATAPLVIAYNPHSRFAAELKAKPWYQVITEPGFLLGRTDPRLDPKGKLTVQALQQASQSYHDPGLAAAEKSSSVFPEEELVGRLEAGQLDAAFFYSNEAAEQHLPTVGLGTVKLAATYTVTVLDNAPDPAGATAFVQYLLGDQGRAIMTAHGLSVPAIPAVSGDTGVVPAPLRSQLPKPSS